MARQRRGASPASAFAPITAPENQDDLSSHAHRLLIGVLGAALPFLVWLIGIKRPTPLLKPLGAPWWMPLDSISAYYFSGGVAAFIGVLAALAVFLFTYQGYDNASRRWDRFTANIAGLAALGVAFFPTAPPAVSLQPSWWSEIDKRIHYGSACTLFVALTIFSLFLFPQSAAGDKPSKEKRGRNAVYRGCGFGMVIAIGWAAYAIWHGRHIFAAETMALWFFAASWLWKGQADWTAEHLGKRAAFYTFHPDQLVRDLVGLVTGP